MVSAVSLFALAAWRQYDGYQHGHVTTAGLILTLCGAAVLTVGGWLGGSVVFVHGTRVLAVPPDGQPREAAAPSSAAEVRQPMNEELRT
jgi:uncharacterized membrane protein